MNIEGWFANAAPLMVYNAIVDINTSRDYLYELLLLILDDLIFDGPAFEVERCKEAMALVSKARKGV
jgi:hypothetical protein